MLLYCSDDDGRSLLIVQMHLWRFSVSVVGKILAVAEHLTTEEYDLVLLVPSPSGCDANVVAEVAAAAICVETNRDGRLDRLIVLTCR